MTKHERAVVRRLEFVRKHIHRRYLALRIPTDLAYELCCMTPCGCEVKENAIQLLRAALKRARGKATCKPAK